MTFSLCHFWVHFTFREYCSRTMNVNQCTQHLPRCENYFDRFRFNSEECNAIRHRQMCSLKTTKRIYEVYVSLSQIRTEIESVVRTRALIYSTDLWYMPDLKNLFACTRLKDRARSRGAKERDAMKAPLGRTMSDS